MVRKLVLAFTGLGVASAVALFLLTIPLLRRLPKPSRVSMDGITTIDDAVEACRRTQLHGWDLVAYAQNLAARKFTYSGLNTWDTPSRAFERGMGYCEQQLLALKRIYDQLGSRQGQCLPCVARFLARWLTACYRLKKESRAMPGCESGSETRNSMCVLAQSATSLA